MPTIAVERQTQFFSTAQSLKASPQQDRSKHDAPDVTCHLDVGFNEPRWCFIRQAFAACLSLQYEAATVTLRTMGVYLFCSSWRSLIKVLSQQTQQNCFNRRWLSSVAVTPPRFMAVFRTTWRRCRYSEGFSPEFCKVPKNLQSTPPHLPQCHMQSLRAQDMHWVRLEGLDVWQCQQQGAVNFQESCKINSSQIQEDQWEISPHYFSMYHNQLHYWVV